MKKNFFKVLLLGVFALSLGGGFVGCKDYDDDISRIDKEIAALKTELASVKATADAAATAAANAVTEAKAKTIAEQAIAAANLATKTEVQTMINDAIKALPAIKTDAELTTFVNNIVGPIVNRLDTEIAGLKASDTALAINQLKLQEQVLRLFGANAADYKNLTDLIAELENGTKTANDVNWAEVAGWVEAIEADLNVVNVQPTTLIFEPMVWTDAGGEAMLFHTHGYLPLTESGNQYKPASGAKTVYASEEPVVSYTMNSKLINASSFKTSELYFAYKEVATRALPSAPKATFMGIENGKMKVKVTAPAEQFKHYNKNGEANHPETMDIVQLNAPLAGSTDVVSSNWAILYARYVPEVHIAFNGPKQTVYTKTGVHPGAKQDQYFYTIDYYEATKATVGDPVVQKWEPDAFLEYDKSLDLMTLVKSAEAGANYGSLASSATASSFHTWNWTDWSNNIDIAMLGYTWKFDVVSFTIGSTNQQDFITLNGSTVTSKVFGTEGAAAIGRTPLIRASIMNGANIVATAFIKLEITRPVAPGMEVTFDFGTKYFDCTKDLESKVTVEQMNVKIYNAIGLSKAQFHAAYSFVDPTETGDVGKVEQITEAGQETTYTLKWTVSAADAWKNQGKTITNVAKYQKNDGTSGPVVITFKMTLPKFAPAINTKDIYESFWTSNASHFLQNTAVPTSTGDSNASNNTFVNDVYAGFVHYTVNSSGNPPAQQKGRHNWQSIASDYTNFTNLYDNLTVHYKFAATAANNRTITVNGVAYIIEVSTDGLSLTAKVGSSGAKQTIATLAGAPNNAGSSSAPNWQYKLQYYGHRTLASTQRSEYAQILLNNEAQPFTAQIQTLAYACADKGKTVTVGGDKATFDVRFIRPVYAEKNDVGYWIDAESGGSQVKVLDVIKLRDWRPNYFEASNNLYGFYGITLRDIKIDTSNATIQRADGTGSVQKLQGNVTLQTSSNRNNNYFVYTNTGNPVTVDHIIKFSATLDYNWGTLSIPVEITLHPHGWVKP